MLSHFNRLGKAASVAALTVGVAFAVVPAQKASAQAIVGAGASSVTSIFDDNNPVTNASGVGFDSQVWNYTNFFGTPYRYVVSGSSAGLNAFLAGTSLRPNTQPQNFAGQPVDFVSTDSLGTSFGVGASVVNNRVVDASGAPVIDTTTGLGFIAVNPVNLNIAFPVNVKFLNSNGTVASTFDVSINGETACRIIRGNASLGDPTNWNQVRNSSNQLGPNVPIRRVVRGDGDVNGITATIQNGNNNTLNNQPATIFLNQNEYNVPNGQGRRGRYGLVQACNNGFIPFPGQPVVPPLATFVNNPIPNIIGTNASPTSGTVIPNIRTSPTTGDIIVPAATVGGVEDPFNAAINSGNDNNSGNNTIANPGSYSLGVINAVRFNNGAIGYSENALVQRAIDDNGSFPAAQQISRATNVVPAPMANIGGTILSAGPNFVIFREDYLNADASQNLNKVVAAQNVCYGAIFSGFLSNRAPQLYPREADFNINAAGGQFPFSPIGSTEQGNDTDNYGNVTTDFGPCQRIGGF